MKNTSRDAPATYLVGRSGEADIVLSDPTVSRLHAELVRGTDGGWYLTDRRSTGGTHVLEEGEWIAIDQDHVHHGDRLRLGGYECTLDDLLRRLPSSPGGGPASRSEAARNNASSSTTVEDDRPWGAVVRNPETGAIQPREDD